MVKFAQIQQKGDFVALVLLLIWLLLFLGNVQQLPKGLPLSPWPALLRPITKGAGGVPLILRHCLSALGLASLAVSRLWRVMRRMHELQFLPLIANRLFWYCFCWCCLICKWITPSALGIQPVIQISHGCWHIALNTIDIAPVAEWCADRERTINACALHAYRWYKY